MTSSTEPFAPLAVPRLGDAPAAPAALFRSSGIEPPAAAGLRWPDWSRGGPEREAEEAAAVRAEWQRGLDEGRSLGEAEAATRLAPAFAALQAVTAHLAAIADTFARDRERDLHALAVVVAERVLQREIAADPAWVATRIERALEQLPLDSEFVVRLNPADLDLLASDLDGLRPDGRAVTLTWHPDSDVPRGGFVVETPQRLVDGRPDVALRALYERMDHD